MHTLLWDMCETTVVKTILIFTESVMSQGQYHALNTCYLISFSKQPFKGNDATIPILEMKKLRPQSC